MIGIVGARGLVGQSLINLILKKMPNTHLKLFSSKISKFKTEKKEFETEKMTKDCFKDLEVVFFCSNDKVSLDFIPAALKSAIVIDNSSTYRLDDKVPLIVPEINESTLTNHRLIANPNCSTIQLNLALNPFKKDIKKVFLSSYQAMSGAGRNKLNIFNANITSQLDCIPIIGDIDSFGFSDEENKIREETRKILSVNFSIHPLCVRVPVINAHAQVVFIEMKKSFSLKQFKDCLKQQRGLKIADSDDLRQSMVSGEEYVFVSRIRSEENGLLWTMWIVGDNLKKGSALNALQIWQLILDKKQKT